MRIAYNMGVKTRSLNPRHSYVPWIVINGVHTQKQQMAAMRHLEKVICDIHRVRN